MAHYKISPGGENGLHLRLNPNIKSWVFCPPCLSFSGTLQVKPDSLSQSGNLMCGKVLSWRDQTARLNESFRMYCVMH